MELNHDIKGAENCPDFPSLYIRPQPSSIEDLGVPKGFLAELALKHAFYLDVLVLKGLAERMKVNLAIITECRNTLSGTSYWKPGEPNLARKRAVSWAGQSVCPHGRKRARRLKPWSMTAMWGRFRFPWKIIGNRSGPN